jgi:hypothetical protein
MIAIISKINAKLKDFTNYIPQFHLGQQDESSGCLD